MTVLSNDLGPFASSSQAAPTLRRRMACFVYEGLVLFGVALIPGAAGAAAFHFAGQTNPLQGGIGLQLFSLLVYGAYFTFFWSKRGQTLPMQTWRIRVVRTDGSILSKRHALARYLLCWVWIAPGFAFAWASGYTVRQTVGAIAIWIVAYALSARFQPRRQFWHDVVCGTRLENHTAPAKNERR